MKRKLLSMALVVSIAVTMLTGCGKSNSADTSSNDKNSSVTESAGSQSTDKQAAESSDKPVSISFYTTETGKDDMFLDIIAHFEEENPNIKVEYIAAGDDQLQKWMSLYASNEGPTVAFMDPVNIFENKDRMRAYNPQESAWLDNVDASAFSCFTFDGQIYGIPGTAAGIGLLYNQKVLDNAVGGTFDPSSIKTRKDLEDLFIKIENTGVAASMFTGVNWSLGAHFLGMTYGEIIGDVQARLDFVEAVKGGKVSLIEDSAFNAYMDSFDLIAKYNYNKADPLVGNVNLDGEALATGKVGTWFMGDWAWTYIAGIEGKDAEFGMLPIPVSDNESDVLNTIIPTSYAKGYCIDASQNSEEEQLAGLKFVEYITMNAYAQQIMAKVCGQALPYTNANVTIDSPLGLATQEYIAAGKTYDFYGTANMMPSDFWYENGAFMCEYLAGACDRKALAEKIENYWKGLE